MTQIQESGEQQLRDAERRQAETAKTLKELREEMQTTLQDVKDMQSNMNLVLESIHETLPHKTTIVGKSSADSHKKVVFPTVVAHRDRSVPVPEPEPEPEPENPTHENSYWQSSDWPSPAAKPVAGHHDATVARASVLKPELPYWAYL